MTNKRFLAGLVLAALPAVAVADITVEPWQMHEGTEGLVDHATNSPEQFKEAFGKATIPTEGWQPAPLGPDGTVNFNPGSKIVRPKGQIDFAYFKTTATVEGKVEEFKITFGVVDDAARVYLNGVAVPEADIIGRKSNFKSIDLRDKVKQGKNEIVVVQFDQHPPGNTLRNLGLEVNGEEISIARAPVTVGPWERHDGDEGLVDFETRTLEQRKEAFSKAKIPDKGTGWVPAELRKDGSVVYQAQSQVAQSARQLDFTYFQTTVDVPKGGVKKLQVLFDLVNDGARIYLINSAHPDGYFDPATDVYQVQHKLVTADFTEQVVEGENRIVVVQFDQSRPGQALMGLRLIVAN